MNRMIRTNGEKVLLFLCLILFSGGLVWAQNAPLAATSVSLNASMLGKLSSDMRKLARLNQETDELYAQMDKMCQTFTTKEWLSVEEEQEISNWVFAMLNVHKTYYRIAQTWVPFGSQDNLNPKHREKALDLSFAAFVEWARVPTYFYRKPYTVKRVWKKVNELVPELEMPAGQGTTMISYLGDSDLREKLSDGFNDIWKTFESAKTTLLPFQKRLKESYDYVSQNAPNPWKVKVKTILKNVGSKIFQSYYKVNIAVSTWVGDNKYRPRKPSIHYDRIQEMIEKLKPGDVLLERENWYLSNIFLPGFWKHGIMYVGTIDDIKRLGLDKNPIVAQHLKDYCSPDHLGHTRRVIEAVSEGVVMSAMEEATDADYICAFRPRISEEQKKQAIITAFSHYGKPYDFQFNFQTADKIVCTELVYRCFYQFLTLNLQKNLGRWALSADDILRKFIAERNNPDRDLDFVFFLDSDIKTQATQFKDENALCDSIKRSSVDVFLKTEVAPPSK